jgi:hypothetical protein
MAQRLTEIHARSTSIRMLPSLLCKICHDATESSLLVSSCTPNIRLAKEDSIPALVLHSDNVVVISLLFALSPALYN